MRRFFLRWLAPVLLTVLVAGISFGQRAAPPAPPVPESTGAEARGAPALQYFVAVGCTVLILFIVCKPSRKTQ